MPARAEAESASAGKTGGSGGAIGLPANFRKAGLLDNPEAADKLPDIAGHAAVLAGSCSLATRQQIEIMSAKHPSLKIDPVTLAESPQSIAEALEWATPRLANGPVLISASADPEEVQAAQDALGCCGGHNRGGGGVARDRLVLLDPKGREPRLQCMAPADLARHARQWECLVVRPGGATRPLPTEPGDPA